MFVCVIGEIKVGMILSYKEVLGRYGSYYEIKKAIAKRSLFKIHVGFYSTTQTYSELELITRRFPDGILTMNSAFYIHALTDVVPDCHFIATKRNGKRIHDEKIRQSFASEKLFPIGKTRLDYNGTIVNVYDKERMLIELLRNKDAFPYDYYKEILANYRRLVIQMDIAKVYTYLELFGHNTRYAEMLETEVL